MGASGTGAEALRQAFSTIGVDHVSSLIHPDNAASHREGRKTRWDARENLHVGRRGIALLRIHNMARMADERRSHATCLVLQQHSRGSLRFGGPWLLVPLQRSAYAAILTDGRCGSDELA